MEIRFHDSFFKDLDNLSNKDVQIFEKKRKRLLGIQRDKNTSAAFHIVIGSQ